MAGCIAMHWRQEGSLAGGAPVPQHSGNAAPDQFCDRGRFAAAVRRAAGGRGYRDAERTGMNRDNEDLRDERADKNQYKL